MLSKSPLPESVVLFISLRIGIGDDRRFCEPEPWQWPEDWLFGLSKKSTDSCERERDYWLSCNLRFIFVTSKERPIILYM
jgi:hypothetical protein